MVLVYQANSRHQKTTIDQPDSHPRFPFTPLPLTVLVMVRGEDVLENMFVEELAADIAKTSPRSAIGDASLYRVELERFC